MLKLYGLANCDSCRRARRTLEGRGLAVEMIDLRRLAERGELDDALLTRLAAERDWQELLNRRSSAWRQLDQASRDGIDRDRALTLMREQPTLIRRPLLDSGNAILIGAEVAHYGD
ncbi:ArsC/Spx/MgsR family protein [Kushneria aurantia]|uniref:ArsC/Spx/MgsR family protein n=1 Tax=Kushneria aurantia TaxID=504092 RepID=A0ABV6G562_9GAMM|nr:ArsC/Spx/MgsR family protein [Kushneria aurantia]